MSHMKIALLIDTLGSGGAQRQIVNLACGLTAKGIDCNLIYYHDNNHYKDILEKYKVRTTLIQKRSRFDVLFFFKLRNLILQGNYSLLYAYLFTPSYVGVVIKLLAFGKIKLIISERSYEGYTPALFKKMRALYRWCNLITANSHAQVEILKKLKPHLSNKIKYIPNSIDVEKFYREQVNTYPAQKLKILAVGRIEKNKNPLTLIKAIQLLKKTNDIDIEVNWAGAFHKNIANNDYLEECNRLIDENNLMDSWHWLGEITDVKKLYEQTDVVYHGSFGEGFPNVICEGLSMSCLVVASNVYDHPYIIEHGVNGFLFDPSDFNELYKLLLEVTLLSKEEKSKISKKARLTAEEKFSMVKVLEYNIETFGEVLTNK